MKISRSSITPIDPKNVIETAVRYDANVARRRVNPTGYHHAQLNTVHRQLESLELPLRRRNLRCNESKPVMREDSNPPVPLNGNAGVAQRRFPVLTGQISPTQPFRKIRNSQAIREVEIRETHTTLERKQHIQDAVDEINKISPYLNGLVKMEEGTTRVSVEGIATRHAIFERIEMAIKKISAVHEAASRSNWYGVSSTQKNEVNIALARASEIGRRLKERRNSQLRESKRKSALKFENY